MGFVRGELRLIIEDISEEHRVVHLAHVGGKGLDGGVVALIEEEVGVLEGVGLHAVSAEDLVFVLDLHPFEVSTLLVEVEGLGLLLGHFHRSDLEGEVLRGAEGEGLLSEILGESSGGAGDGVNHLLEGGLKGELVPLAVVDRRDVHCEDLSGEVKEFSDLEVAKLRVDHPDVEDFFVPAAVGL